ncbi:MAG: hypothetical protein WKF67_13070 [Rubrobacteraceae bacterium]
MPGRVLSPEDQNQPLRASVSALLDENRRATDKDERVRARFYAQLQQTLEEKIATGDANLNTELAALGKLLTNMVGSVEKQTKQYQEQQNEALIVATAEREKSAAAIREEKDKAQLALLTAQNKQIDSAQSNLLSHINQQVGQIQAALQSQKELTDSAFAASREAIAKAETSNEKRFEDIQRQDFLPREVFVQEVATTTRRHEELLSHIRTNSSRVQTVELQCASLTDISTRVSTIELSLSAFRGQIALGGVLLTIFLTIVVVAANMLV